MNTLLKAGIAAAALGVASLSVASTASAAGGLWDRSHGGSMKDSYVPHAPASAHRCYLRGDVGYSHGGEPVINIRSPRYAEVGTDDEDIEGTWLGEIGAGCGLGAPGSRGFRADFTVGFRGDQDITGYKPDRPGLHYPGTFETKINSLTAMANIYYDLGTFRRFMPYVGVGLGIVHHDMDDTSFNLGNDGSLPGPVGPAPSSNLRGNSVTNFAWSLMAGFGYKLSERAILDFGYRFIDLGDIEGYRSDICTTCIAGGSREKLYVNDMHAHEFKVGLRYHFGGGRPAPAVYK